MALRFLFFGCWNNGACSGTTPLKKTIDKINSLIRSPSPPPSLPFLIVAGDNYYPTDKGEECDKKKVYESANLLSGLTCLDGLELETFLLLGNHDVEKLGTDVTNIQEGCEVIDFQLSRYSDPPVKSPTTTLFRFKDPALMQKQVGDQTTIIMFDSTIYDVETEEEGKKYLDCYKKIVPSFTSIDDIKKKQEKQRAETIKGLSSRGNNIKTLIFACHHPIVSARSKKGKFKEKIRKQIAEFLLPFKNIRTVTKFILLCADDHLFQYSTLTITKNGESMTIEQYIAGTGGAELDTLSGPYEEKCDKKDKEGDSEVIGDDCFTTEQIVDDANLVIGITKEPKSKTGAKKDKPKKPKKEPGTTIEYNVHITEIEHGFLDITVNTTGFNPTFIRTGSEVKLELPTIPLSTSGGGRKSRRRKRPKILTRKNK
jgi:hypothetical protein